MCITPSPLCRSISDWSVVFTFCRGAFCAVTFYPGTDGHLFHLGAAGHPWIYTHTHTNTLKQMRFQLWFWSRRERDHFKMKCIPANRSTVFRWVCQSINQTTTLQCSSCIEMACDQTWLILYQTKIIVCISSYGSVTGDSLFLISFKIYI